MKHPFILILSLLCASTLYGQQKTWSLGECIETGIRNNLTLRNSRIDVQKKQTTLSLSRSYLLPKLEANFQAIDYLMKPANVTTGTLLGNDFPDDPTWQKIQSMQYGVTAGIQLSVPLYNQTLLAGIKVAETLRNLSSLSHEKAVEGAQGSELAGRGCRLSPRARVVIEKGLRRGTIRCGPVEGRFGLNAPAMGGELADIAQVVGDGAVYVKEDDLAVWHGPSFPGVVIPSGVIINSLV